MNGGKIVGVIFLVLILIGAYYIYEHNVHEKQATDGAVHWVTGKMSPEEEARFKKENAGETADGQSEHKTMTARQDDATGFQDGAAAAGQTPATPSTGNTVTPNIVPAGNTQVNTTAPTPVAATAATPAKPEPPAGTYGMGIAPPASYSPSYTAAAPVGLPVTDSQSPNAPNGMRFGGSGNYQWYRQGNLTWRIDTASGRSCIIYATLEEWRKQIVYSHGCGRNA